MTKQSTTPTWDDYFMRMADLASSRSKDRSTKVGCVIVGPDNDIRATGYNGFPRHIADWVEDRHQRPEKYLWTEHAERNAIYAAARIGVPLKGCRAYVPLFPCMDCARGLVQCGIVEIVSMETKDAELRARWAEDHKRSLVLFKEAGVKVRVIECDIHPPSPVGVAPKGPSS